MRVDKQVKKRVEKNKLHLLAKLAKLAKLKAQIDQKETPCAEAQGATRAAKKQE